MLNVSFVRTSVKKYLQNALVNSRSWSNTIIFGNPWCIHHALRKKFAVSKAVAVPIVNTICPNFQTYLPPRWHHILVTPTNLWWSPWRHFPLLQRDRKRLQEANLLLERGTVHFALDTSLHKMDYLFFRTWLIVPPWCHCIVVFPFLWLTMGLSCYSFKTNSFNLPRGTYTQLCLDLSNPSTNLTFLNALPLRS